MLAFTGSSPEWNKIVANLPGSHLLQTSEWAQVKKIYGWQPTPFVWYGQRSDGTLDDNKVVAAAMILRKVISFAGISTKIGIHYSPKGPLLNWNNNAVRGRVLEDLEKFTQKHAGIFLKIDPDMELGRGIPGSTEAIENEPGLRAINELTQRGWRFSSDQIQFRNTAMVDLSPSEEEILARMKQKTRYNIRLASKKGVTVRQGTIDDLPMLYSMYAETSIRDGFVIRNQEYYTRVWSAFMNVKPSDFSPMAVPLIADVGGEPVAAVFVYRFSGRAYYIYGMSREVHREKMPNHLLQWEAMRYAKSMGCRQYDLWGAPDTFTEEDSMWGVYKFKEGLGGEVVRTLGAWDYAPHPLWYKLYSETMPRILSVMRNRGKRNTKHQHDTL
jgi:lipid II:glycine glycyltransferase (peptidoglycan interpeptide bridge formation enzyme)